MVFEFCTRTNSNDVDYMACVERVKMEVEMTDEEKYEKFINIVCEMLGFNKPIDILKLCQITSDFIRPFEMKIKDLEQVNEQLKQQIEKMKCCKNCKKYRMLESQVTLRCLKNQRTNFCCEDWELAE